MNAIENNQIFYDPSHEYEQERLLRLKACRILNTPPEDSFESIVHLLQKDFHTPIALISILDNDRVWLKARIGVENQEFPREISICQHTVLYNNVTVIPDLQEDARFINNPIVEGAKNPRFYAGAPIIIEDNFKIGAVCVLDHRPRHDFSSYDMLKLSEFAAIVSRLIVMRRDIYAEAEKNTAKSEFLHNLAHELKTPLGVVSGASQILASSKDIPASQKKLFKVMNQSAAAMLDVVGSLNDVNQIEMRGFTLNETTFSLPDLVKDIRMMMGTIAKGKGIALDFDTTDIKGLNITADRARLKQVLINVIGNALKYTDDGGVKFKAYAHSPTLKNPHYLEFRISDTGLGIPEDDRPNVFNRHGRCALTLNREGSGLGLTISKQIIGQMGGKIDFESEVGKGTQFWICLPYHTASS